MLSTLAEVGLMLAGSKTLLARLRASMLYGQVAAYAAHHRACLDCGALPPLKDRRTRRLQTLFGTVEVEAPRFEVCRCRPSAPLAKATLSPVCALLTARCTPGLERVQAELSARTSFRDAAGILVRLPGAPCWGRLAAQASATPRQRSCNGQGTPDQVWGSHQPGARMSP